MQWTPLSLLIGLATGLFSFWLGRRLSNRWREKKRQEQNAQARAAETRQQRRARERRENKHH